MAKDDNQKAISVNDAVTTAISQLYALLPGAGDVLLEEVEISDDDRYWLVTLSHAQSLPNDPKPGALLSALPKPRFYKVFRIDRSTGEVRAMKIREFEHA